MLQVGRALQVGVRALFVTTGLRTSPGSSLGFVLILVRGCNHWLQESDPTRLKFLLHTTVCEFFKIFFSLLESSSPSTFDPFFLLPIFPPSPTNSQSHGCDYRCRPILHFRFLKHLKLVCNFPSPPWIQYLYVDLFLYASFSNRWKYHLYIKGRLRAILKKRLRFGLPESPH